MTELRKTLPCPPCTGECNQGRECSAEEDALGAAQGFVRAVLWSLVAWAVAGLVLVRLLGGPA